MTQDINRAKRPNGFKTMSILGYIAEGISFVIYPILAIFEISEGLVFSALFSFLFWILSPLAIVGIFMFKERKSILALNIIRAYLWALIPLSALSATASVVEAGDAVLTIMLTIVEIAVCLAIAMYWQQNSHTEYLKSFNH